MPSGAGISRASLASMGLTGGMTGSCMALMLAPTAPAGSVAAAMPTPRATYRVQLHAGFTFDDAAAIVDYLADLGVSHLYCSPFLQAAPGSTHGYDVVDHHRLNAELGGERGLRAAVPGAGGPRA